MGDLIPVTTWSGNLRHLARPEALEPDREGGCSGKALCDSQTYAEVHDQTWLDAQRLYWYGKPAGSQLITEMRPCKRCEKAAARLGVAS